MKNLRSDILAAQLFDAAANAKTGEEALQVCQDLIAIENEYQLVPRPWRDFEEVIARKIGTCSVCKQPWAIGDRLWWRRGEKTARHYVCSREK